MESTTPKLSYVFQPHKQGSALKSSAKTIVMNVFHKLQVRNPNDSVTEILDKTSDLTGVSTRSILRMQNEFKIQGSFSTPGRKRPARKGKATRMQKFDDFVLSAIRRKVHLFFKRNEIPTVAKVMKTINEGTDLPNLTIATTRRLMQDLGFVYKKRSRNSMLIEREDIQVWRRKYLRQIRHYRNEGRTVYYTDETWVNFGHTKQTVWQDTFIKRPKEAFMSGLSTGLKAPTGKGSRLIITHAGSEKGFVKGAADVFKAKKSKGDYHEEMNGDYYEQWFKNKLLPNLDPNSIIVIDNASYHSVFVENIPNTSTKKDDIRRWLTSKNIAWNSDMLKAELLNLVQNVRSRYEEYRVDRIAALHGHTVLRLPPYHCELNPIENIWSVVKGKVAAENRTFKEKEVEELTKKAIDNVSNETWKNCVGHIIKEEELMWELDGMCDTAVDNLIIHFDPDSTDTASEGMLSTEEVMSS
ncbi:uncharacterized protein LOC129226706 [Uloborus diversus]|uniref:uncharacterized protein LOC129226706 n=1 Tax=Uloborus diversus TaxID=327109 RepID=UPI002409AD53|nr:uncharacterized protein LOC129226706 [Uloborus diversus]